MTSNDQCKACLPAAAGFTLRCPECSGEFHLHEEWYAKAPPGTVFAVVCPGCEITLALRRPYQRAIKGAVFFVGDRQVKMLP